MGTPRTKPRAAPIHGEARPPTPSRPLVRARATSRAAPACSLRSGRCAAPARQAAYRGGRRLPCRLRQRPLSRAKCRRPAPPSRPARAPRGGRPAHTGRGEWETSVPGRRSIPSVWAPYTDPQRRTSALCRVSRAPREYEGQGCSEYSGTPPSTAEYVSSRARVGRLPYPHWSRTLGRLQSRACHAKNTAEQRKTCPLER